MSIATNYTLPIERKAPVVVPLSQPEDQRLATLMGQIIEQKEAKVGAALKGRVNVSEGILIGGDLFSMGYLGFQGAQILKPSLAAIPAIGFATLVCGEIAGAINIGVALVCLKEAVQAFENGDNALGARLFLDFVTFTAIGLIMILASLATKVAALGCVGALFATNPWLLPVLFFIASIPIICEIGKRIFNIHTNRDLASQLKGNDLGELIRGKEAKNPYHLRPLIEMLQTQQDEKEVKAKLSEKMEQLQADMGVAAAIEVFRLMQKKLRNEEVEEQFERVKKRISEWNQAQYVRFFQQVLFAAAFGVSMAAFLPKINAQRIDAIDTFAMAAGNAVPLYMDIFWPFKRNTPIVVPKVDLEEKLG